MFALIETWLSVSKQKVFFSEFRTFLSGYDIISCPRPNRKGGGVDAIIRQGLDVKQNDDGNKFTTFEYIDLSITAKSDMPRLILLYRPPASSNNGTVSKILDEFATFLQSVILYSGRLLCLGALNFHVENPNCSDARQFLDLIHSVGLVQHVKLPTHNKGHTLDLVMTRASNTLVRNISVSDELPSDHSLVQFDMELSRPTRTIISRKWRNQSAVTSDSLNEYLSENPFPEMDGLSCDQLADTYSSHLTQFVDSVAPVKTKITKVKPRALAHNTAYSLPPETTSD